jgi:hypothetical protein
MFSWSGAWLRTGTTLPLPFTGAGSFRHWRTSKQSINQSNLLIYSMVQDIV